MQKRSKGECLFMRLINETNELENRKESERLIQEPNELKKIFSSILEKST